MAQLYTGTSGWAYSTWKPDFYPAKLAQKKFLNFYAGQFNTVEVNFTFRQLVKESTLGNWIADTPDNFRFGVKAHQMLTHIKRLKGTGEFLPRFVASLEPLARSGKLGPVLFQLPPNMKFDAAVLREFLGELPRVRVAFEFRHASWFVDETWAILRERNAALCVAESETLASPDVTTADFAYYRFRKASYPAEERVGMLAGLRAHTEQGRDVYAYFKHEETPEGVLYARDLLSA
jgi:uncharacterized protein YecE (DUF72 family)